MKLARFLAIRAATLSQSLLGLVTGASQASVSAYLNGKTKIPLRFLIRVAELDGGAVYYVTPEGRAHRITVESGTLVVTASDDIDAHRQLDLL